MLAATVVAFLVVGCGSTEHASTPQRPYLLPKAGPHGVGKFRCPLFSETTVDAEACATRRQLELNAQFDRAIVALWPKLRPAGKRRVASAQRAWNDYVTRECAAEAGLFAGGTEAPVASAYCRVRLTRTRVVEVRAMLGVYCNGKPKVAQRRCLGR